MEKLYIIVRNDLRSGLQCAQACHAQYEFSKRYPELMETWAGNLVVLQVQDERALQRLAGALSDFCLVGFQEPDLGGETTAFAVEGKAEPFLTHLPLALRKVA